MDKYLTLPYIASASGVALLLILSLLISFLRKKKARALNLTPPAPSIPEFIEVFDIERQLFVHDPFDSSEDSIIEEDKLQSVLLTLVIGLREYQTKVFENPTEQHKAMDAVGTSLEGAGVVPIAYTQWNQSPIQGIAAKVIIRGKVRTALFGPSLAMVRNTAPLRPEFIEINESATKAGHIVFIFAIDGLAYAIFDISHRLQEVINS